MRKVLTIAGSDSSGGAGIQADIKTITVHKMYAMSVITALTAQNTTGVSGIMEVEPEFVAKQMDSVFTDIFPDAVKIGMVANAEIIRVIAGKLKEYGARNIVVDPVMVATSGSRLMRGGSLEALINVLIPEASIITPNIAEAEMLSGVSIKNKHDMETAVEAIAKFYGKAILIKGGHLEDSADDLLVCGGEHVWLNSARVDNPNTHGTGCTLSSAIACGLAGGLSAQESVKRAKAYVKGALEAQLNLGYGSGPLNHCHTI